MGLLGHLLPKNTLLIIGNQSWIEENSGRFFCASKAGGFLSCGAWRNGGF
jgi:hypothetical protein